MPRPDLRGGDGGPGGEDTDERVADVQYREVVDCAVGHGVSARWDRNADGQCRAVETIWIPDAQVERVEPRSLAGAMLGMEATWMNRG